MHPYGRDRDAARRRASSMPWDRAFEKVYDVYSAALVNRNVYEPRDARVPAATRPTCDCMSSQNLTGGETPPRHLCPETVGGVLYHLARHPGELLIRRWNWKSALLSSLIRGLIFFFTNLVAGLQAAIGAMLLEAVYRALTAGFYGSMTQAFRHARPAWLASLTAMVLLPVVSHVLEYFIHWVNGTPRLMRSILASAALTVLSTLFNLHAMRRGALVVGHQQQSLAADMRRMPMMVATFAAAGPLALWRLGRRLTTTRRAAVPMGGEAGEKTCAD